jgi:hypothetical protein
MQHEPKYKGPNFMFLKKLKNLVLKIVSKQELQTTATKLYIQNLIP